MGLMGQLRDAIDAAELEMARLRGDNAMLRLEVKRLRAEVAELKGGPCHYCDAAGWHEMDCPKLLDQVAERMPIG